jgi:butyryl-CoA dehydrogenase
MSLVKVAAEKGVRHFLGDATLYLEYFGTVIIAWQWLKQGISAVEEIELGSTDTFYQSKIETLRYYFTYELPKCKGLIDTLKSQQGITLLQDQEHLI